MASRGIRIIGWVQILVVPLSAMGGALLAAVPLPSYLAWSAHYASLGLEKYGSVAAWTIAFILVRVIWAAASLSAGIGLLRLRAWARKWVVWTSVCVAVLLFIDIGWKQFVWELSGKELGAVKILCGIASIVHLVWVSFVIVFLNRSRIRQQFGSAESQAHLGVLAIAVLCVGIFGGHSIQFQGAFLEYLRGNAGGDLGPRARRALWDRDSREAMEGYREREKVSVESGAGQVSVMATYDGAPLDLSAHGAVKLTFYDLKTGRPADIAWRLEGSEVLLPMVPTGMYRVEMAIDANQNNGLGYEERGLPGDLMSSRRIETKLLENGQSIRLTIPLERVIRLLRPEDSTRGLSRRRADPMMRLTSPVEFEWEPIEGATSYRYFIRQSNPNNAPGQTKVMASGYTPDTSLRVELPPSPPGQHYFFILTTHRDQNDLGTLAVSGADWWTRAYDFIVE